MTSAECAICTRAHGRLLRFSLVRSVGKKQRGAGGLWLCQGCWERAARRLSRSEVASIAARARWAKASPEERRQATAGARAVAR